MSTVHWPRTDFDWERHPSQAKPRYVIAARRRLAYRGSMTSCDTCVVRNRAVCSALDPDELAALGKIGRKIDVEKDQTMIWEGDDSLAVANILEGVFKLTSSMDDGRQQIISVAFPADFLGRPFGKQNAHSITAMTDARLCVFPRAEFERFARDHPDLEHKLLEKTLEELDRARRWMLLLGRKTAPERVASFLVELSDRLAETGCHDFGLKLQDFELPFGRQQVADILGLTIETVSRQLTLFRNDGMIDLPDRRHVHIKDRDRLTKLSQLAA